ncbi:uncharacterized protein LOC133287344 isoform X2 [Gastrolobium bilobum]|nr:uncharacterized protein LOC133287344 isoform X2 [Gastrolobium bilobum]
MAVATSLEPKRLAAKEESSNEELQELDERETLRRMRISKANKGQTPWNKGRKHSAETLQKIKERTRLAMQNPKVKMKLANLGHKQTTETRKKIDTCCIEWQNLIAEASRQGYVDQEELLWDSYETLDEQLKLEWLESVKQRKQMQREPGSKRAPKSPEQRKKIAEAISAKWADHEYRGRVCSAMAKFHGTEMKPSRLTDDGQSTRRNIVMKKDIDTDTSVKRGTEIPNQIWLEKSKSPAHNDCLMSSKPEMIKSIREQRAAAETKLTKAIERARLLIAEAEKAAKALEVTATKSPIVQASLIESRKFIAAAIQSLESIDTQGLTLSNVPSVALSKVNEEKDSEFEALNQLHMVQVNGHKTSSSSDYKFSEDFVKISLQKFDIGDSELHLKSTNGFASFPVGFKGNIEESSSSNQQRETELNQSSIESIKDETLPKSATVTKKWVRGRLVDVVEEKQEIW